jgi:hypothetical protein
MSKRTNLIALMLGTLVGLGCGGKASTNAAEISSGGGAGVGETAGTPANMMTGGTLVTTGAGSGGGVIGQGGAGQGGTSVVSRVPVKHRAVAIACDHDRPSPDPEAPDSGFAQCHSHAECMAGPNGRCSGNGRGGWSCTYDQCFEDSDCASPAGDNGPSPRCRVDSDCGDGYCSPTFGGCGNYWGVVSYFCHTPEDECIDDGDCGKGGLGYGPYCAYAPAVGHWKCSSSECVG